MNWMYYHTNANKVREFMEAFKQDVRKEPTWPSAEEIELRLDLIEEEYDELKEAIYNGDGTLVDVADALADILYVVYGAAHTFGIPIDDCFREVHVSNMSKLGEDGKPMYREDGKVLKGPKYREPNLKETLYGEENGK